MRNFLKFLVSFWYFGLPYVLGMGGTGAKMRERLFLKVTFVNRCRACHFVHTTVFGRLAGLSKGEMESLADLDTAKLDEKTLAALTYVEHLAVNKGEVRDQKLLQDVKKLYTAKQVRCINNARPFANGWNWVGNGFFTVLRMVHIASYPRLPDYLAEKKKEAP